MQYHITDVVKEDYPQLVSVWESSVKATHHFLSQEDFDFYKGLMFTFFDSVDLKAAKDASGTIQAFLGTSEENIEMLFVADSQRGKGIGKLLLFYALEKLGCTKVDVNQDNQQALAFYNRFGFATQRVSPTDGFGKPYPILHLELVK